MNGIAVLVSLAAIGVDYGWQPSADGQLEYIVQIEPALLEGMKGGEEIVSEILPEARNVRRFRIRVGTGPVPRVSLLQNRTTPRSLVTPNSSTLTNGARGQGSSSVLPPQSHWGSHPTGTGQPPGARSSNSGLTAEGRLVLPPPPLLGADGKTSILVQPGHNSASSNTVLPPAGAGHTHGISGGRSSTGALDLAPPPGATGGSSWPSTNIVPSGNSPAPNDIHLPPPPGNSSFPANPGNTFPPPSTPAVRPVPSPSINSGTPAPIRFGQSDIKPPSFATETTHTTAPPTAAVGGGTPTREDADLLATNAQEKPVLSKKEASELTPKPWLPLVLTSLALFASLAANAYLGWIMLGIYRRYRDMVDQLHQAQTA